MGRRSLYRGPRNKGPYEFFGDGKNLLYYHGAEAVVAGAAGCVAPETRLFDPVKGTHTPIKELCERGEPITVLTINGPARAECPFLKGIAPLYEIRLKSGNTFIATEDHLVLTQQGWAMIACVDAGSTLIGQSPDAVLSKKYIRTGEYYDLHVPGDEHYFAEGIFHHNTGKSLMCLSRIFLCAEHVPHMRALIVRKTRESLTESALATWEKKIIPEGHPCMRRGGMRKLRSIYEFPNGSEVIIGGMDKPSKIMSTEFDMIFVQECIELREEDWEALITRLRNGRLPFQQIFGDTNPDAPTHWIKRREAKKKLKIFTSRHEDNPYLFDRVNQKWTREGANYIAKLDALSGAQLQRLRFGQWSQAEGIVYPDWDNHDNVLYDKHMPNGVAFPPPDWPRLWSVDFGYSAPFVCQFWARDHDGRMYLYRQIYYKGRLVEDHAARIIDLWRQEAAFWARKRRIPVEAAQRQIQPEAIVCDHDAQERATLERHLGMTTTGARKFVKRGIQLVSERIRKAGDGKPRLFVLANSLDQKDVSLEEDHKPTDLVTEINAYVWNKTKDEPVKENDHACDAARYAVMHWSEGMSGLWEVAEPIMAPGEARDSAMSPEPRLRYGVGRVDRKGGRLFGGHQ